VGSDGLLVDSAQLATLVDLLLDGGGLSLSKLLVFEQEGKLLEGAVVRLRVEHVDGEELESDPSAVDGQELPVDGAESEGVDVSGEETTELSEDLLDTDTHGTLGIGEQLDKVGCSELAGLIELRCWRCDLLYVSELLPML
jgi:hypothetical protein